MKDVKQKVEKVNKAVELKIASKSNEKKSEEFLFSLPYKVLPITTPANEKELPLMMEDVIVAVKKKLDETKNTSPYGFEMYTENGEKIAESDENNRMIFDRSIEDKFSEQIINILKIQGEFEPASVQFDENLRIKSIETYFDMIGRKLVVMNKKQKERVDKAYERDAELREVEKENMDSELEQNEDLNPNIESDQEKIKQVMKDSLQIDVYKMAKIDPGDGAFWENNPDIKTRNAYAVLDKNGALKIVGESNGRFEELDCFKDSSNRTGRTTIIRNDEDNLIDNTKNTYGSLQSTRYSDLSYTMEFGNYGEGKLVERRATLSNTTERERYVSREVATNHTDYGERNLEGNRNPENVTINSFRESSTKRDASKYGRANGKGGIAEIADEMKKSREKNDFTMETFAANVPQRVIEAERLVKEELSDRGFKMTADEEKKLIQKLQIYIGDSERIMRKEDAVQYANEVMIERKNKENPEKKDDSGEFRLDQAYEARETRKR